MLHRVDHRNRLRRKNLTPWQASENEPVVVSGITPIFEQNPATKIRRLLHYWIKLRASGIAPVVEIACIMPTAAW